MKIPPNIPDGITRPGLTINDIEGAADKSIAVVSEAALTRLMAFTTASSIDVVNAAAAFKLRAPVAAIWIAVCSAVLADRLIDAAAATLLPADKSAAILSDFVIAAVS